MALKHDIKKIPDRFAIIKGDEVQPDKIHHITEALIWASITIGINKITKENVDEWWLRINMMMRADNFVMLYNTTIDAKYNPSIQDIKDRIGLSTNAAPRTRAQFMNLLKRKLIYNATNELEKEKQDAKKEQNKSTTKIRPKARKP